MWRSSCRKWTVRKRKWDPQAAYDKIIEKLGGSQERIDRSNRQSTEHKFNTYPSCLKDEDPDKIAGRRARTSNNWFICWKTGKSKDKAGTVVVKDWIKEGVRAIDGEHTQRTWRKDQGFDEE